MRHPSNTLHPKLTFEQANTICHAFLPVGEAIFEHMDRLREFGFGAFAPYHKFLESFSGSAEEVHVHRRCLIEQAKHIIGTPWPMRVSDEEAKQLFSSPFLRHLRDERDKMNGVPEDELSDRYDITEVVWRREIDPCLRQKSKFEVLDKDAYESRWQSMLQDGRHCLEEETVRFATGIAGSLAFDNRGRYAFFSAVMARDAAALGFNYDKFKSQRHYPVFSKSLSDDWDLSWAIEEPETFFLEPV